MPNGLRNWSYKDVIKFLKQDGFEFCHEKAGSHEAWKKVTDEGEWVVEINKTKSSYPIRTLETMIRQSGLSKKDWKEGA